MRSEATRRDLGTLLDGSLPRGSAPGHSGVLLCDGGLGSALIARGLAQGSAPETWNLSRPDDVVAVHRAYVDAGSMLIHANSFGASPPRLALEAALAGRCAEVNQRAVELARQAAGDRALVAGDIGPTGLLLPPMGENTEGDVFAAIAEQARALAEAGADLLSIETMYDLREATAAVRAAARTGLPVMASMTFDRKRRGYFSVMGDRVGPSLAALEAAGAAAVGFNCTLSHADMVALVQEAVAATALPVIAQPNAGQPRVTPAGVVYDTTRAAFAHDVAAMAAAGARVIGGCCGTTPEFIRSARALLDATSG